MQFLLHQFNRCPTIVTSDGCRKNRRHCIGVIGRAYWAKWGKLSSTGLTDRSLRGISAFNVLLSRDDVKHAEVKSSAPVEPTVHRSIALVQLRQQEKKSATATWRSSVTGLIDALASVQPMVFEDCCSCVREANGYFRAQSDRKNRCTQHRKFRCLRRKLANG